MKTTILPEMISVAEKVVSNLLSLLRGNLSGAPGANDLLASQRPDCSLQIVMMLLTILQMM